MFIRLSGTGCNPEGRSESGSLDDRKFRTRLGTGSKSGARMTARLDLSGLEVLSQAAAICSPYLLSLCIIGNQLHSHICPSNLASILPAHAVSLESGVSEGALNMRRRKKNLRRVQEEFRRQYAMPRRSHVP